MSFVFFSYDTQQVNSLAITVMNIKITSIEKGSLNPIIFFKEYSSRILLLLLT